MKHIISIKCNTQTVFLVLGLIVSTGLFSQTYMPVPVPGLMNNGNSEATATRFEKTELKLGWFDPVATPGEVPKYEKLEIGVNLPLSINEEIAAFINASATGSPVLAIDPEKPGLNPFDPDDIDLRAEFSYRIPGTEEWTSQGIHKFDREDLDYLQLQFPVAVNGFYYKEFARNQNGRNPDDWNWNAINLKDKSNSDYNFRIRFAPPVEGMWKCKIVAVISDSLRIEAQEFTFKVVPSSEHGNMRVGPNKRYFLIDQQPYFPVGRNIPEVVCNPAPDGKFAINCDKVDRNNESRISHVYHEAFLQRLRDYGKNGGDYFRMIVFPQSLDIEFEKLNNYYDRLDFAWEMDRLVDVLKEEDLMMHLDLQYTRALEMTDHAMWNWNGTESPNIAPDCIKKNDVAYCYGFIPGVKRVADFFSNEEAIKNYKKRLRYYVSRWGYSTHISEFELVNEINLAGSEGYTVLEEGNCKTVVTKHTYQEENEYKRNVYLWQNEMCKHLKTDQYFPHLAGVSYANFSPKDILKGDSTYYGNYVDVASSNFYPDWNVLKNQDVSRQNDMYHGKVRSSIKDINKPYFNSELGFDEIQSCSKDVGFITDIWATTFSGVAMTSMPWHYQQRYELTQHQVNVKNFVAGYNFDGGKEGNWNAQVQARKNDQKSTFYCLVSQEKKRRAIGVVVNNTVNYWTMATNEHCKDERMNPAGTNLDEAQVVEANSGKGNKLKLRGMHIWKKYDIVWYNALTMQEISTNVKRSGLGKLRLDHPALANDVVTNGEVPFMVAYKIKRHK